MMFTGSLKEKFGAIGFGKQKSNSYDGMLSLEPGCCEEDRIIRNGVDFSNTEDNEVTMVYLRIEGGMFGLQNECDNELYLREQKQQFTPQKNKSNSADDRSASTTASVTAMMDVEEYLWSSN